MLLAAAIYGNVQSISKGVSQVPRNQSGVVKWHVQKHSNKTVKFIDNIVIKQLWHLITSICMLILIYLCLPKVDLEEG